METVIHVDDVTKSFGTVKNCTQVLNGVNLAIEEGEFVSLMGASGSGKSTLLYLIGGLDRNFGGSITVCGEDISKMKEKRLSRLRLEKIGFVFQFYNLVQNLNVCDNILLPSRVKGESKKELNKRLDEILEITGLTGKRKSLPNELSGGEQQRVAVARAIIGNPTLLLADEATGNLDSKASMDVMNLFKRINEEKGLTILQVTHSSECAGYGTRTIRLVNGKTEG